MVGGIGFVFGFDDEILYQDSGVTMFFGFSRVGGYVMLIFFDLFFVFKGCHMMIIY